MPFGIGCDNSCAPLSDNVLPCFIKTELICILIQYIQQEKGILQNCNVDPPQEPLTLNKQGGVPAKKNFQRSEAFGLVGL
jgi:hypothetical protein